MRTLFLLAALLASSAFADTAVKYGANISKTGDPLGGTKALFISYQEKVFGPLISQYEFGAWFDHTGLSGRSSSALAGASIGVQVNAGNMFSQALFGPALITSPDSVLGGLVQFNNDIVFGFRDLDAGSSIGACFKHISNAGLSSPNRGRDLIMFRVSLPW